MFIPDFSIPDIWIWIFSSRIRTNLQRFKVFLTQKIGYYALGNMIREPGSGFFLHTRIPGPDPVVKKAMDPGSGSANRINRYPEQGDIKNFSCVPKHNKKINSQKMAFYVPPSLARHLPPCWPTPLSWNRKACSQCSTGSESCVWCRPGTWSCRTQTSRTWSKLTEIFRKLEVDLIFFISEHWNRVCLRVLWNKTDPIWLSAGRRTCQIRAFILFRKYSTYTVRDKLVY